MSIRCDVVIFVIVEVPSKFSGCSFIFSKFDVKSSLIKNSESYLATLVPLAKKLSEKRKSARNFKHSRVILKSTNQNGVM